MLKIDYIEIDGLYYPKLIPNFNETSLGKYGRMRKRYLEEYKQELYMRLLISNKLIDYLIDLNERAKQLLYNLERAYLKKYPLTNDDYLKDLQTRYQARAYAQEIVLHDIVYSDDN